MRVLIVGSTSGIGEALAGHYLFEGHEVIGVGRRASTAFVDVSRYEHMVLDITMRGRVTAQLGGVLAAGVDVAYICAGVGELNAELNYDVELPTIETNVVAWTQVVDMVFNAFVNKGGGHLVIISSVGGLRGEPAAPAYSASKAYQMNYAEALRKKAYKIGKPIYVTDVRPGLVDTRMAKGEGLFWVMPPKKVASQIVAAVERRKGVAVVTRRWRLLHCIMKHLPQWLYVRM